MKARKRNESTTALEIDALIRPSAPEQPILKCHHEMVLI